MARRVPNIQGDVMARLVESFAPRIYGYCVVKEVILLVLVGGSAATGRWTNSHVLLVGDTGIGKSVLLEEAAAVAPLGMYMSGRGAAPIGLTDGRLLCVDDFNNTEKTDRAAFHKVMERTAGVAKVGVTNTMNAQVSILAAATPKQGFWDDSMTLSQNVDLPDSLLTGFDLIYVLKDVPDAANDMLAAKRMLGDGAPDALPPEDLTAYLESVSPLMPAMSGAVAKSIEEYVAARAKSGGLRLIPRQLEVVKRMAGARAKIYRRDHITIQDAMRAIELMEQTMAHAG